MGQHKMLRPRGYYKARALVLVVSDVPQRTDARSNDGGINETQQEMKNSCTKFRETCRLGRKAFSPGPGKKERTRRVGAGRNRCSTRQVSNVTMPWILHPLN